MRNLSVLGLTLVMLGSWHTTALGADPVKPEQSVVKPQGDSKPSGGQSQEPECE